MRRAIWIITLCLSTASILAHDIEMTEVLVVLKSDGSYLVDVTTDLDTLGV